jgi:hypothetical protein
MVEDSLSYVLGRKITPHVWKREKTVEGRDCTYEVFVQVFIHVRGFQWEQLCTYLGCSGNNRICTWVVVRIITYIHTNSSG